MSVRNLITSQSKPNLAININSMDCKNNFFCTGLNLSGDLSCQNIVVDSVVDCATVNASSIIATGSDVNAVNANTSVDVNVNTGELNGSNLDVTGGAGTINSLGLICTGEASCDIPIVNGDAQFTNDPIIINLGGSSGGVYPVTQSRGRLQLNNIPLLSGGGTIFFTLSNAFFTPARLYFVVMNNSGVVSEAELRSSVNGSATGSFNISITNFAASSISSGSTLLMDFMAV